MLTILKLLLGMLCPILTVIFMTIAIIDHHKGKIEDSIYYLLLAIIMALMTKTT